MYSITPEQILVVSVLLLWFLFPLGILVSFIKQSNEAHKPKVTQIMTANEIAHSAAYAPDLDEDDDAEDFEQPVIPAYQIPKNNSNNYHPKV